MGANASTEQSSPLPASSGEAQYKRFTESGLFKALKDLEALRSPGMPPDFNHSHMIYEILRAKTTIPVSDILYVASNLPMFLESPSKLLERQEDGNIKYNYAAHIYDALLKNADVIMNEIKINMEKIAASEALARQVMELGKQVDEKRLSLLRDRENAKHFLGNVDKAIMKLMKRPYSERFSILTKVAQLSDSEAFLFMEVGLGKDMTGGMSDVKGLSIQFAFQPYLASRMLLHHTSMLRIYEKLIANKEAFIKAIENLEVVAQQGGRKRNIRKKKY